MFAAIRRALSRASSSRRVGLDPLSVAFARRKNANLPRHNNVSALGGNDEAARVHRAYGRKCHMAVRCDGTAAGADISSRFLGTGPGRPKGPIIHGFLQRTATPRFR